MNFVLQPWQVFLLIIASWSNQLQQEIIEYLRTENSVLRNKFGKKRILLNDDEVAAWPSKLKFWDARYSQRSALCSRLTRSCLGTVIGWPTSWTTPFAKRRRQVLPGHGK